MEGCCYRRLLLPPPLLCLAALTSILGRLKLMTRFSRHSRTQYHPPFRWERRLHFLFYLFAVGLCFHVPTKAIPNGGFIAPVLGSCIILYTVDACYVYLYMCEKIDTTAFPVLSSGIRISMWVLNRFRNSAAARGGYAYVNIPWINDKQWHPFSLFEDPYDPATLQVFLLKNGDWTDALHKALLRDTTRP